MSSRFLFSALLSLTAAASLSAQAPAALHTSQMMELDVFNVVRLLEQNALLALLSAVGLMGVLWVCYVFNACARLNKPRKNTVGRPVMSLLVLIAGLSVFCGSCSVEQRAMAARYRTAEAAEIRPCPMNQHQNDQVNTAFNSQYAYTSYSNWHGPAFCKYCGQRIFVTK